MKAPKTHKVTKTTHHIIGPAKTRIIFRGTKEACEEKAADLSRSEAELRSSDKLHALRPTQYRVS
jgi:hypothetical protein